MSLLAKVVLLGDTGVGKSSLVLRFITNEFKPYVESTIGASFMSKLLMDPDGSAVKFQIWDTAGQEKYHSLAPMYYKGAAAAIVVYDITKRKTYDTLKDWIAELRAQGHCSSDRRQQERPRGRAASISRGSRAVCTVC